jgi:FtsP/CotA-like multicopper oxidase with cupredoxin domain
VANYSW